MWAYCADEPTVGRAGKRTGAPGDKPTPRKERSNSRAPATSNLQFLGGVNFELRKQKMVPIPALLLYAEVLRTGQTAVRAGALLSSGSKRKQDVALAKNSHWLSERWHQLRPA